MKNRSTTICYQNSQDSIAIIPMKNPLPRLFSAALLASLCLSGELLAEVIPHALFGDNAVLQQGRRVPVWGSAEEGEKVTVSFGEQKAEIVTKDGKWMVWLDPMKANSNPQTMTIAGANNTVTLSNVLVGEVWVCSGQSNMEWKLSRLVDPAMKRGTPQKWQQDVAAADYPEIRHLTVPHQSSKSPLSNLDAKWEICSPQTIPDFSAVGYYFGRDLHRELKVPIGLIHSSWGGTLAEAWTRHEALASNPALASILKRHASYVESFPKRLAQYKAKEADLLAEHQNACIQAKKEGKEPPRAPAPPHDPHTYHNVPSRLYNGMINPLLPYAIQGVIWYQGESNSGAADVYRNLFPALIADWRAQWGQGDFPFLFVQITPHNNMTPEIREAQFLTLGKASNTAMAVTTDVGDAQNIHPIKKEPVGQRLALAARAIAYAQPIEYSGPLYKSAQINGNSMTISFDHTGTGLLAQDGPLKGFAIAGEDKVFVPAQAEIKGETVVVTAPQVTNPVAVRYGWANVPEVNLYNQEGLPASPFRTDDWKTQPASGKPSPTP
jgi:sialate O-acetylesterase